MKTKKRYKKNAFSSEKTFESNL